MSTTKQGAGNVIFIEPQQTLMKAFTACCLAVFMVLLGTSCEGPGYYPAYTYRDHDHWDRYNRYNRYQTIRTHRYDRGHHHNHYSGYRNVRYGDNWDYARGRARIYVR